MDGQFVYQMGIVKELSLRQVGMTPPVPTRAVKEEPPSRHATTWSGSWCPTQAGQGGAQPPPPCNCDGIQIGRERSAVSRLGTA